MKFLIPFMILLAVGPVAVTQQSGNYKPVFVEAKTRSRDAAGKVVYADWKPFETRLIENMADFKPDKKFSFDKYGGNLSAKFRSTGYFRVEKIEGRWWIIDPLGHPAVDIAVNSVTTGKSPRNREAFSRNFGDQQKWINETRKTIHELGFVGTGSWSDVTAIVMNNKTAPNPIVYTVNLDMMSGYGNKRGGTYQVPGHKAYPNDVIFVFDPAFERYCDSAAEKLVSYSKDPNLLGYFSDNEMPFGLKNLEGYLTLPENDPGRVAAENWMKEKGLEKTKISDNDRADFVAFAADRYFRIVRNAIRKYDTNHMYLGTRLYSGEKNIAQFMASAGKYVDILSINYYNAWTPSKTTMAMWSETSGRPFMITEFYTKGEDSKLGNISGAGWLVHTQADRGKAYQNFCLGLLESKACVGWHWFKYMDNDPTEPNAEPSNTDANKGLVDNDYKVYAPLAKYMQELNLNRFALIKYFDSINR